MEESLNSEITLSDLLAIDGAGDNIIDTGALDKKPEFEIDLTNESEEDDKPKEETEELEKKELESKEEEKEEEEEKKPETGATPTVYLNVAKKFLEDGKWFDVKIEEDGKEIKLSEATEIDEEMFFQILEEQEKATKEEIDANYVSVSELDENSRKLINIIKNGGDLTEIFQTPAQLKRPFEGWNLEDEKNQERILYWQLTSEQRLSPEDAQELVKKYKKDLSIDTKVQTIVKHHQERFDKGLEEREKQVLAEKQAEEVAVKEYRKTLGTFYKNEGLTDSVSRRLVDAATKKDETGTLIIDGIYEKLMEDPQKAKDLIFFMLEPENYLKAKGANIKKNEQLDLMRKVSIIRQNSGKTTPKKEEEKPTNETVFDNIELE